MYNRHLELSISANNVAQGSSDAAGRRVKEILPAVLSLLEECLNALADDAAAADSAEQTGSSSLAILDDRWGPIHISHLLMSESLRLIGSCLWMSYLVY